MAKSLALLVTAVLLGLGGPGVASADPIPGLPDFPEIDESFAVDYGLGHQFIPAFEAALGPLGL